MEDTAPTQVPITSDQLMVYLNQMAQEKELLKTQILACANRCAFDVVLGRLRAVEQENHDLKQQAQVPQRPEGGPVLGVPALDSEPGGNNGAHSQASV